jgi:uncharacterized membrane protein YphA (DoxX/SURF4 family)
MTPIKDKQSAGGLLRRGFLSPRLYLLVRIALALLFIYAGSVKLMDPKAFARLLSHYDLVPEALLPLVAVGLPTIEVLAGLALIFDIRAGLYAISGLMLLFLVVLGYGVWKGLEVDCGCFGPKEMAERNGLTHALYRDFTLLGGVAFLHWSRRFRNRGVLLVHNKEGQ